MENKQKPNKTVVAGMTAPGFFLAGCVAIAAAVITDTEWLNVVGAILIVVASIVILIGIATALWKRQWLLALGGLGGLALCLAASLFFAIMIGAGQHHPRKEAVPADEDVVPADMLTFEIDSIGIKTMLSIDGVPDDSLLQRRLAERVADVIFYTEDDEAVVAKPAYEGDFNAYLQACLRQRWGELWTDIYDYEPDADGDLLTPQEKADDAEENGISYSNYEQTLSKTAETDSLITWQGEYNLFHDNAAYPVIYDCTITVSKADGQSAVSIKIPEE